MSQGHPFPRGPRWPSQDAMTTPIHTICKQHLSACLHSLRPPRGLGGDVLPRPRTKRHQRCRPLDCSDLAAQGSSSAKCEEEGGHGGAEEQQAQIDLFLPPLLSQNTKPAVTCKSISLTGQIKAGCQFAFTSPPT